MILFHHDCCNLWRVKVRDAIAHKVERKWAVSFIFLEDVFSFDQYGIWKVIVESPITGSLIMTTASNGGEISPILLV